MQKPNTHFIHIICSTSIEMKNNTKTNELHENVYVKISGDTWKDEMKVLQRSSIKLSVQMLAKAVAIIANEELECM